MEDIQEIISSPKCKHNVKRQNSADRERSGEPVIVNQVKIIKKKLKAERKKTKALERKIDVLQTKRRTLLKREELVISILTNVIELSTLSFEEEEL